MKKLLKISVAWLLCAVVMVSVASCSAENKLVGRWEGTVSYEALALGTLSEEEKADMGEKLSWFEGLEMEFFIVFNADGTFSAGMEEESFNECMNTLSSRIYAYIEKTAEELDMTLEEFEEQYEEINGQKPQEMLAELFVDEEDSLTTGPYRVVKDRLHLFFDDKGSVDLDVYDTFNLDGDTLTLTERYDFRDLNDRDGGDIEALQHVYPLKLKKQS